MSVALPLYGFEEFLMVCADGEVGVFGGLIGSFHGDLSLILIVVDILSYGFLPLL
jgi:hypothetical protein